MAVIGTAGHVDHGKSTLVQALTGRDPDRWTEEKERGLTIDLGFAWFEPNPGQTVAFVDVPGHERFIKNMLAGVEMIDAAVLVVAADEGWMPQTEEHLAVLDLLEVPELVVALTKADLVDDDLAELAHLEVEERLAGTRYEGAPVHTVSARTGQGVDRLVQALAELGAAADERHATGGRPRLWVDRSFAITGAGTVVTGTLTGGPLSVGDELVVYPHGSSGRVRGLQQHERPVEVAAAGHRTAVNLVGLDRTDLPRGSMLGRPDEWRSSDRWLAELRQARYEDRLPTDRGAYHVHHGTGAWTAEIRPIEGSVVLIKLSGLAPARAGDRFIVRDVGRRVVVAGGRILDPRPPARRARAAATLGPLLAADPSDADSVAAALLDVRGTATVADLGAWSGGGSVEEIAGGVAISKDRLGELAARAREAVASFHEEHPLRPGIPRAHLARELGIPHGLLDALIGEWPLRDEGSTLALPEFAPAVDADEAFDDVRTRLEQSLAVPRVMDLELDGELLHLFLRQGKLVRVSEDFVFTPRQLEQIVDAARGIGHPFSVAEFRDAVGLSRKYAVPLLEYLDASGVTARSGDLRTIV